MIGRRLAQYDIEEELGRGGMGIVYRARDTRLQRQVARRCDHPCRESPALTIPEAWQSMPLIRYEIPGREFSDSLVLRPPGFVHG